MELSSSTVLDNVNDLVSAGHYALAYQAVLDDLNSQGLTLSADDQNVLTWLSTAVQVNSGENTLAAVAVRANNAAAVAYENGETIALFGSEEQAASDAVAIAFFSTLSSNGGTLQTFDDIANSDATTGLTSLGVSQAGWAGAMPAGYEFITGFSNSDYYDGLTTAQQEEADVLHLNAMDIIATYESTQAAGASTALQNEIVGGVGTSDAYLAHLDVLPYLASTLYDTPSSVISTIDSAWTGLTNYLSDWNSSTFGSLQTDFNNLNDGDASGGLLALKPYAFASGEINIW